ncbi:hypothetical protein IQ06DRAFT_14215 [Phaeosphaeriaceae sp. SRC1lsM3a]|nr:hypothetical protein IQ06DRAFT_14215 [Stagonospora sp. SRC1lsM3a]
MKSCSPFLKPICMKCCQCSNSLTAEVQDHIDSQPYKPYGYRRRTHTDPFPLKHLGHHLRQRTMSSSASSVFLRQSPANMPAMQWPTVSPVLIPS